MSTKINVAWLTKQRFVFGEGQKLKWCIHVSSKMNVHHLPNVDFSLERDKKLMLHQYIFKMVDTHISQNKCSCLTKQRFVFGEGQKINTPSMIF